MKVLQNKVKDKNKIPFTVVLVSLKDLKFINEQFGYVSGDILMKEIASYFKKIVNPASLFRFSDNGISIIIDQEVNIGSVIARIRNRFNNSWCIKECDYILSVSIAAVAYPNIAKNIEDIINGINLAIETAKENKDNYSYCDLKMIQRARRKGEILKEIKEIPIEKNFQFYMKPIYSVKKNRFEMGEILLRMNNSRIGTIRPDEFIPILEESGQIIEVTYWILEEICKTLQKQLKKTTITGVAINFSYIQFLQEDLLLKIFYIINKYKIPPSMIIIEITESTLIEDIDRMKQIINQMTEKGFRFEIDDFGTGYSNISTVIDLPVETVKLDKYLIWAAEKMPKSKVIVENISFALKKMNIDVLAEGVETESQNNLAKKLGCDYIQGFFYAKPIPLDKALECFITKIDY